MFNNVVMNFGLLGACLVIAGCQSTELAGDPVQLTRTEARAITSHYDDEAREENNSCPFPEITRILAVSESSSDDNSKTLQVRYAYKDYLHDHDDDITVVGRTVIRPAFRKCQGTAVREFKLDQTDPDNPSIIAMSDTNRPL